MSLGNCPQPFILPSGRSYFLSGKAKLLAPTLLLGLLAFGPGKASANEEPELSQEPVVSEVAAEAAEPAPITAPEKAAPAPAAPKPWLGIVPRENADGVFVDLVQPDTTAEKLGLERNDRLLKLAGKPVRSVRDLSRTLSKMKVGDTLQVTFSRKGAEVNTSHALLPKPESANDHDKSLAIQGPVGVAVDRIERELKLVREALANAGINNPKQDLATAMADLSVTLDALPGRLETAADHFKRVYPDGEFTVNIEITIRSHAEDDVVLDLSPTGSSDSATGEAAAPAPAPVDETAVP
jgi:membrane-associated protease RseP (regulator of RpoE activity)